LFPGFDESNSRFDPASGDVVLSRKPTFLLPEPSLSTRIWFLPGFFRENRDWRQGDPGIRRGGSRTNPLKVAENFAKVERSTIGSGGRGDARSQTIGIARTTSIPGSCRTKRPASSMIPLAPGSMNEKAERVRRKGELARRGAQSARAGPPRRSGLARGEGLPLSNAEMSQRETFPPVMRSLVIKCPERRCGSPKSRR
jgi:hypothetical protein